MEGSIITAPAAQQLTTKEQAEQQVFYRLVALWAMCEAFLGGILHAFKLPGTGLFVGGAAVLCISLIAWHCPKRSAILKATVLVILVKGMLSPHSPLGAYLAVAIQGSLGYLLFWSKAYFRLSCFTLGIVTQLQSALQRLVVLVVVFGSDIYSIANGFVNYILKKAGFAEGEYVLYIIIVYIGFHVLMGVMVGWLAGRLPEMIRKAQDVGFSIEQKEVAFTIAEVPRKKKQHYKKYILLLVSIGIVAFYYLNPSIIPSHKALKFLLRAVVVFSIWYFLVMTVIRSLFEKWVSKKKDRFSEELKIILAVIPDMKRDVQQCWHNTAQIGLFKRIPIFLSLILIRNTFADMNSKIAV